MEMPNNGMRLLTLLKGGGAHHRRAVRRQQQQRQQDERWPEHPGHPHRGAGVAGAGAGAPIAVTADGTERGGVLGRRVQLQLARRRSRSAQGSPQACSWACERLQPGAQCGPTSGQAMSAGPVTITHAACTTCAIPCCALRCQKQGGEEGTHTAPLQQAAWQPAAALSLLQRMHHERGEWQHRHCAPVGRRLAPAPAVAASAAAAAAQCPVTSAAGCGGLTGRVEHSWVERSCSSLFSLYQPSDCQALMLGNPQGGQGRGAKWGRAAGRAGALACAALCWSPAWACHQCGCAGWA